MFYLLKLVRFNTTLAMQTPEKEAEIQQLLGRLQIPIAERIWSPFDYVEFIRGIKTGQINTAFLRELHDTLPLNQFVMAIRLNDYEAFREARGSEDELMRLLPPCELADLLQALFDRGGIFEEHRRVSDFFTFEVNNYSENMLLKWIDRYVKSYSYFTPSLDIKLPLAMLQYLIKVGQTNSPNFHFLVELPEIKKELKPEVYARRTLSIDGGPSAKAKITLQDPIETTQTI